MNNTIAEQQDQPSPAVVKQEQIQCLPQGICSWDYWLIGSMPRCSLYHNRVFSGGYIQQGETRMDVVKSGLMLPRWALCAHNDEACELVGATSKGILSRGHVLEVNGQEWSLDAMSMFGGSYQLERSGEIYAMFRKDHAFTRRAKITILKPEVEFVTLAFSFWLIANRWRTDAQSSGG